MCSVRLVIGVNNVQNAVFSVLNAGVTDQCAVCSDSGN